VSALVTLLARTSSTVLVEGLSATLDTVTLVVPFFVTVKSLASGVEVDMPTPVSA
jgi:hypothetical protein